MRILVLGGYGLIGSAILKRLLSEGHEVVGLGRSVQKGKAVSAKSDWIAGDLSKLTTATDWTDILTGFDVVVNAAGVLQAGLGDNVSAVQEQSIKALIEAGELAGLKTLIQISAPGVSETADTAFYQTKARADTALKESTLNWVIFRPGLVISPQAYGGTSLLRMLAAFPVLQPLIYPDVKIQTVFVGDIADAVVRAVNGGVSRGEFDLVSSETYALKDIIARFRNWLGFRPANFTLTLPVGLGKLIARGADLSGWLGWRSSLRTTALKVLGNNVTGNPEDWKKATGAPVRSLDETLDAIPSTAQERIYARTMLAFPVLLITLAVFWLASGLIGLFQADAALAVLGEAMTPPIRKVFVLGGGLADISIGLALLFRPWVRWAALASILLSLCYLFGSVVITPHLWTDPLGPMVKVFPAMALALAVAAIAETR